jgi:hypothetical protein
MMDAAARLRRLSVELEIAIENRMTIGQAKAELRRRERVAELRACILDIRRVLAPIGARG